MRSSILLFSALSCLTSAAAIIRRDDSTMPVSIRDYYSEVSSRIAKIKTTPTYPKPPLCNLSAAVPPAAPTPLPSPPSGLSVYHVAIGRGTQNYTCSSNDSSAAPVAIGALATLYNASCIAANYPDILTTLPAAALNYPIPSSDSIPLSPSNLVTSGHHYFADATTPVFNLDTAIAQYGLTFSKKKSSCPAPSSAMVGQFNTGYGAVPWLYLLAQTTGTVGPVQAVYRLNTAGGNPPASCQGQPAAFEVQYAAEYWFYG